MRRGTCRFCGEGVSWSWVGGEEMPPRAGMRFKGFAGSEMSPSPHRANQPPTEASAQARNPSRPSSRNHNSPSPSIPYDTTPTQPAHRTTTHAIETPTVSKNQGSQPAIWADHNLRRSGAGIKVLEAMRSAAAGRLQRAGQVESRQGGNAAQRSWVRLWCVP